MSSESRQALIFRELENQLAGLVSLPAGAKKRRSAVSRNVIFPANRLRGFLRKRLDDGAQFGDLVGQLA
jgi:hypothetical protein